MTDILAGNTDKNVNPFWGKFAINGSRRPTRRRPSRPARTTTPRTSTHTATSRRRATAGRNAGAYALAVGVWDGNSDNSLVSTAAPSRVFSIDVSTYVWQGFLTEASRSWPVTNFAQPDGLVKAAIDPFTGLLASPGSKSIDEWFIAGTEPRDTLSPDTCGADVIVHVGNEKDARLAGGGP